MQEVIQDYYESFPAVWRSVDRDPQRDVFTLYLNDDYELEGEGICFTGMMGIAILMIVTDPITISVIIC